MSPKTMRLIAKPALLAATLIWGATFFITKNALDVTPVFFLQSIRFTTGALILSLLCWKQWKHFTRDYLWRGGAMGLIMFVAYAIQTYGLSLTTPSKNAFLTATCCIIVPFMAWFAVKQRPDRFNIAAALLAVAGVGLVCLNEELTINSGDLLTLLAAVFFAGHMVLTSKVSEGKDIYLLTIVEFGVAALLSWICAGTMETVSFRSLLAPDVLFAVGYLSVMGTTVGLLFQNIGLAWSDPASASVILSLESVFGVLFSVLFYGDLVTVHMLLGFVMIFVAVVCSETKFSFLRKKPAPELREAE